MPQELSRQAKESLINLRKERAVYERAYKKVREATLELNKELHTPHAAKVLLDACYSLDHSIRLVDMVIHRIETIGR